MSGSFRSLVTVLASVVTLAGASRVDAQERAVHVVARGCAAELGAATDAALDVELSNASADVRAVLADPTLRCELVCEGEWIVASVARGADRVEQRIDGGGSAIARRVAIALAELIEATSAAPASVPEPAPTPEPAPSVSSSFRARVRIAGGAWIGGERLVGLGTVELGVELAPSSNFAIVIGAAGTLGSVDVPGARLDVRLVSAAASLRIGGELGPLWLGAGPAIRGGAVLWTGTPSDPGVASGADTSGGWLGLGAVGAALVRLGDAPVRVGLEVEGGGIAVYSGALVLGALAEQIGGGWLELRAAADVTFE